MPDDLDGAVRARLDIALCGQGNTVFGNDVRALLAAHDALLTERDRERDGWLECTRMRLALEAERDEAVAERDAWKNNHGDGCNFQRLYQDCCLWGREWMEKCRALEAERAQNAPVLVAAETLDLAIQAGGQRSDGTLGVYLLTGIVDRLHETVEAWRAAREA